MLDLPDELLLEILLRLSLKAIFILRRVCRRLMAVSKEKSLWITMYRRLQEERPGLWCELHHEILDASEMERFVVREARLEKNWSSESPACARPPREIRVEAALVRYLLPGGRWLISGLYDDSSRLVYVDLDSPTPSEVDLLRHPEPEFKGNARHIAIHIEAESDALAFTIAVTYLLPGARDGTGNACCSVWQVELEESERFRVLHRSTFPLAYPEDFGFFDCFVINQHLLLRGTDDPRVRVFEVFDYLTCSNHQLRRGLVVLARTNNMQRVRAIRIMPHNQFLVVAFDILQLFNMPELSDVPSTSLHPSSGSGYPLWTCKFGPSISGWPPAVTPSHLAFRKSMDASFGLLIQVARRFIYVSFPRLASDLLDVHEAAMESEVVRDVSGVHALVGSHRGVWYRSDTGVRPLYLTTFEAPGRTSIPGELPGAGRSESHGQELLSLRLASCNGLPANRVYNDRSFFYFDETSGRVLIPFHTSYTAFMMMEFV